VVCAATLEERVPRSCAVRAKVGHRGVLDASARDEHPASPGGGDWESWGRTHEIQRLVGRSLRAVVDFEALGERTVTNRLRRPAGGRGTRTASVNEGRGSPCGRRAGAGRQGGDTPKSRARPLVAVSVGIVGGRVLVDLDYSRTPRRMST